MYIKYNFMYSELHQEYISPSLVVGCEEIPRRARAFGPRRIARRAGSRDRGRSGCRLPGREEVRCSTVRGQLRQERAGRRPELRPPPGCEGLRHRQHPNPGKGGSPGSRVPDLALRSGRGRRAGPGPGRGLSGQRPGARTEPSRLHPDDGSQQGGRRLGRGPRSETSRPGQGADLRRGGRYRPERAHRRGDLRTRSSLLLLLRPVSAIIIDRRTERKPGDVRPALPEALRSGPGRRGPLRQAFGA